MDRVIDSSVIACMVALLLLTAAAMVLGARALAVAHASRREAELANQSKTSFLAMMSHKLCTPMNGVLGMTHLLQQGGLSEHQAEKVRTIRTCGEGLMVVLNDILDLSKIDADRLEMEHTDFDVVEVVNHAMDMWRAAAEAKGLFMDLKISGDSQRRVLGDPNRFRQIMANLLSNAVKFTALGGVYIRVHIEAPNEAAQIVKVVVADTGPGIAPDVQDRLFEPFSQADASVAGAFGGTGLGLAISRRLARMMNGDLTLQSQKGSGAAFTFSARFAATDPVSSAPESDTAPSEPVALVRNLRVLVAEDNPHNQAVVKGFLHALDCDCELVDDGKAAIQAFAQGHFDLVLMDIQMPVMDGPAALREIRRQPGGDLPIIALTANAMRGDRERYLGDGFNDHLAKPIDPEAFVQVLARAMSGSRGIRLAA